jgi:hypothetical protein
VTAMRAPFHGFDRMVDRGGAPSIRAFAQITAENHRRGFGSAACGRGWV